MYTKLFLTLYWLALVCFSELKRRLKAEKKAKEKAEKQATQAAQTLAEGNNERSKREEEEDIDPNVSSSGESNLLLLFNVSLLH